MCLVYLRSPRDRSVPFYNYTLEPANMASRMGEELADAELVPPFAFTKGMPLLRIPDSDASYEKAIAFGDHLFDLERDPGEKEGICDEETRARLESAMYRMMKETDAPEELYRRMGFDAES